LGVKYKDLNLATNSEVKTISIGEAQINIKQYLPTDKKAAIVRNAIKGAFYDGYVDEILCEAYLHMMIIENYTDIDFDDEEFGDILDIFDQLHSTGTLDVIVQAIDPAEYTYLVDYTNKSIQFANTYAQSYSAGIQTQSDLIRVIAEEKVNNETE
jgi:hypothetical protein